VFNFGPGVHKNRRDLDLDSSIGIPLFALTEEHVSKLDAIVRSPVTRKPLLVGWLLRCGLVRKLFYRLMDTE